MTSSTTRLCLAIAAALSVATAADAATMASATAAHQAQSLLDGSASTLVRRAPADAFATRDVIVDQAGEHVRFERTYRGLPVIGGDFVLHSRGGRVLGVSQTLRTIARPLVLPSIAADTAIVEAGARFGSGFQGRPSARLVVYAMRGLPRLAYDVRFSGMKADGTPTDMRYFVDAANARILDAWDWGQTSVPGPDSGPSCAGQRASTGQGMSLFSGRVPLATVRCTRGYRMVDLTRGGGHVNNMGLTTSGMGMIMTDADNTWGTSALSSAQTVAADVHYGVSMTWDYYKNVHGRLGIANNGVGVTSRVHYGRNYANAFWSDGCFCMTFGDGDNGVSYNPLAVLDVAGHEMSHGVTSRTAGLVYRGESGGLNEATSDIFGTMVEFYANNASDRPDYLIGEKVMARNPSGTSALRYMFKPSLDGASPDCYYPGIGDLNVHYSSGVANHFFYLLAQGAVVPAGFGSGTPANLTPSALVCNGNATLTGIGRAAAQKIWYRALSVYMTSNTDYAAARAATLQAAADLYGSTSTQHQKVAAAWSAVGVN